MEPLTGQPVAVQREHTVEEGVPLLNGQRPILTIDQAQFIVQTRMRSTGAYEQARKDPGHCGHQRDQHSTECLHVLPSYIAGVPGGTPFVVGFPAPADRIAPQELHVTRIRNPTRCSYVMLIVDTRNITAAHRGGNASTYRRGCIPSTGECLLGRSWEPAPDMIALRIGPQGNAVMSFALITN